MKNGVISEFATGDVSSLVHNNHEKEKYSGFENSKQQCRLWFSIVYFA